MLIGVHYVVTLITIHRNKYAHYVDRLDFSTVVYLDIGRISTVMIDKVTRVSTQFQDDRAMKYKGFTLST